MIQSPKGFVWGSSTSGPQTEGRISGDRKGDNLWDYWFSQRSPSFLSWNWSWQGIHFYENWEQDIDLFSRNRSHGLWDSIQWSRIFPNGRGPVNQVSGDFYRKGLWKNQVQGHSLDCQSLSFWPALALQEAQEGWESLDTVHAYVRLCPFLLWKLRWRWTSGWPFPTSLLYQLNLAISTMDIILIKWTLGLRLRWLIIPS